MMIWVTLDNLYWLCGLSASVVSLVVRSRLFWGLFKIAHVFASEIINRCLFFTIVSHILFTQINHHMEKVSLQFCSIIKWHWHPRQCLQKPVQSHQHWRKIYNEAMRYAFFKDFKPSSEAILFKLLRGCTAEVHFCFLLWNFLTMKNWSLYVFTCF